MQSFIFLAHVSLKATKQEILRCAEWRNMVFSYAANFVKTILKLRGQRFF